MSRVNAAPRHEKQLRGTKEKKFDGKSRLREEKVLYEQMDGRCLDRGIESSASPNPPNGLEVLSGYLSRRDKSVAAGTKVEGGILRRSF